VIILCSIFGVFPYYIFRKLAINLIKFKLNNVLRNDCLVFNDDEFSKEDFFNRKFRPIRSRSQNINIMFSLIEPLTFINNNLVYSNIQSKT